MRWVYRPDHPEANENGMVPAHVAGPRNHADPAPNVITDTMPHTLNMADGRHYDSKSRFRAATRARGLEEVGTDKSILHDPIERRMDVGNVEMDVKRAIQEVASR